MSDGYDVVPHDFNREWREFLSELRVALPGVQLLFAFLLSAPFSVNFASVNGATRAVYFVCFLCTAGACAFLIAPSVYHRLHWRRNVREKERMMRTCNRLAIVGIALLAVAMTCAVYVVSRFIVGAVASIAVTAVAGALFATLWFALPLVRRGSSRAGATAE